jgi:hypothetical protein
MSLIPYRLAGPPVAIDFLLPALLISSCACEALALTLDRGDRAMRLRLRGMLLGVVGAVVGVE